MHCSPEEEKVIHDFRKNSFSLRKISQMNMCSIQIVQNALKPKINKLKPGQKPKITVQTD